MKKLKSFDTELFLFLNGKHNAFFDFIMYWACLVSYSRIYNGVHYPSDVIVASVIRIIYGFLVYYILSKMRPEIKMDK